MNALLLDAHAYAAPDRLFTDSDARRWSTKARSFSAMCLRGKKLEEEPWKRIEAVLKDQHKIAVIGAKTNGISIAKLMPALANAEHSMKRGSLVVIRSRSDIPGVCGLCRCTDYCRSRSIHASASTA